MAADRVLIRWGADRSLELESGRIHPSSRLESADQGPGSDRDLRTRRSRDRIAAAVRGPLDSPKLRQGLTPDDRFVFVVQEDLPDGPRYLAPLLEELSAAGVARERVKVLLAGPGTVDLEPWREGLGDLAVEHHDPAASATKSYLASTEDGRRIYLNPSVIEADAVMTVGGIAWDPILGISGTAGYVYPWCADEPTLDLARRTALEMRASPSALRKRQHSDEVGWLIGLFFSLGIVLDGDGFVEAAWFGTAGGVQKAGREWLLKRRTLEPVAPGADLALGTVSRDGRRATWSKVGSVAETLAASVPAGVPIVIVSDLDQPPEAALAALAEGDTPINVSARLRESSAENALVASQLARAQAKHRVHLVSGLSAETVESLGLVAVDGGSELRHLTAKAKAIRVVEAADRFVILSAKHRADEAAAEG